jgi:hypothetical protein
MPENSGTGEVSKFFGIDPAPFYNSGMGGSGGIGTARMNLSELANVVVTTPGASSMPPQPMATVDAGDASIPAQIAALVPGADAALVGPGPNASTGIDHPKMGFVSA